MKTIVIKSLFISFIMLLGCSSKNERNNHFEISLSNLKKVEIDLNDLIDEIQYIPLRGNKAIQYIQHFENTSNYYFIACQPSMILKFDKNGNLINQIGSEGRGPGEYQRNLNFSVSEEDSLLVFLSNNYLLNFYNFSGELINILDIERIDRFENVYFTNEKQLLLTKSNDKNAKFNWVFIDFKGNKLELKLNYNDFDFSYRSYISLVPGHIVCKFHNTFFYHEIFNDTIFKISDHGYEPDFIFLPDKFRMTPERFAKEAPNWLIPGEIGKYNKGPKYYKLDNLFILPKYALFEFSLDYPKQIAIFYYDSKMSFEIKKSGTNSGFLNNYDGGLSFHPISSFNVGNNFYLVSWFFPYELHNHIRSKYFKNSIPKYPEKKKELEKLANSLDENDNPVLMLVKLKN